MTTPPEPSFGGVDTSLIHRLLGEFYRGNSQHPTAPGTPSIATLAPRQPDVAPPVHPTLDSLHPNVDTQPVKSASSADDGEYAFGNPHVLFGAEGHAVSVLGAPEKQSSSLPVSERYYFLPREAAQVQELSSSLGSSRPSASGIPSARAFDVHSVRSDFPALHQQVNGRPLIWLDNAATTHKPKAVIDATSSFYSRDNSNIHRAAHALAARSTDLFENARESVRKFLGASSAKEIVFVRGTTEAINLVAQSYGRKNIGAGDEILITHMEHHANIVPWQLLAEQTGATIRVAPINDRGELILDQFATLLNGRTKLVAITHVSNALGTVNPVEQVIALAHAFGVPVLVDGAQSTPHMPVNVQALDADFYTLSGHKIFGPTGIGVLYGKSSLLSGMPPWQGGGHMIKDVTFAKTVYNEPPEKFEAGTPDIAGVVGLGAAVEYLMSIGMPAIAAYEHALLEYATESLATIPGIRPIGTAANKASVLSFVIPGIPNVDIARHLDKHGIAVRAGHHCAQPAQRKFGVEGSVRPSLAFYNTRDEVDTLVDVLKRLPRN
ncbi:SufS family cysteine desulfurase [Roseimicrobium gellanilyticum]|uniref:cysteine desulfurase n=1 Tax=Roseimicrobium gellanilyticum TaxID=748857 RepID=A0A366HHW5_9BACT|nr:cysteine desulfurase [Roseimicrobium gellanilyticum]RBP41425.1 SufS family cysteine desulfurase [Roseimicrobium gellanilyticum]